MENFLQDAKKEIERIEKLGYRNYPVALLKLNILFQMMLKI